MVSVVVAVGIEVVMLMTVVESEVTVVNNVSCKAVTVEVAQFV